MGFGKAFAGKIEINSPSGFEKDARTSSYKEN